MYGYGWYMKKSLTPICDFVRGYAKSENLRLHMPGHKGMSSFAGMETEAEKLDITEIDGADSLYEANGIILESEKNASRLFGCKTFYSAEGSSLCIRAMLYLAVLAARSEGKKPVIAAGRNAHRTFIYAAAMLEPELSVKWLPGKTEDSYMSYIPDAENIESFICESERESESEKPTAIYLTSPDYLGNIVDIPPIAAVCKKHGVLLLIDNAHGAYLKFLPNSLHPIDLGADMCCDSAHKTLPALTGGAYLHISQSEPKMKIAAERAKNALALFGSTSPSYLILQSLDATNGYLSDGYPEKLAEFAAAAEKTKIRLGKTGFSFCGVEPLKFTLAAKKYGYYGKELAEILAEKGIVCEFADPDFTVMMLTPEIGENGLKRLSGALMSIPRKSEITEMPPSPVPHNYTAKAFAPSAPAMSIREALFSPNEIVPVQNACGKILAAASVSCPPAVPIAISGERIDENAVECFKYYGIEFCSVVKT